MRLILLAPRSVPSYFPTAGVSLSFCLATPPSHPVEMDPRIWVEMWIVPTVRDSFSSNVVISSRSSCPFTVRLEDAVQADALDAYLMHYRVRTDELTPLLQSAMTASVVSVLFKKLFQGPAI